MAHFINKDYACFKGSNDSVRNRQFNLFLGKIRKYYESDVSDIEKVGLISDVEKKIRLLYNFKDLENCDDDQLTYLIDVYYEILDFLKTLEPGSRSPEYKTYKTNYKEVESAQKNLLEARKNITVKSITRALERRPRSTFHIQSVQPVSGFDVPISGFAVPTKRENPFSKGNYTLKTRVKEQKTQSSAVSPNGPPPPPPNIVTPPKSSSVKSRSRSAKSSEGHAIVTPPKTTRSISRSSPNFLDSSRSLQNLGITATHVSKLSKRRRGGKTRKHKKN